MKFPDISTRWKVSLSEFRQAALQKIRRLTPHERFLIFTVLGLLLVGMVVRYFRKFSQEGEIKNPPSLLEKESQ